MDVAWQIPEPDASPEEVVAALRAQAALFAVVASALAGYDEAGSATAFDQVLRMRCQAAVIESLAELHDELGSQLRDLDTYLWRLV